MREAMSASDPCRQIALLVDNGTDIFARIAPLMDLVGAALATDASVRPGGGARGAARRDGLRDLLEVVARSGVLRPEVGVDRGADIVFGLQGPEMLNLLTVECSWPIERYKAWLNETLC